MSILKKMGLSALFVFAGFNISLAKPGDNFYKKLKGKIGNTLFITMDLLKKTDSITKVSTLGGHYYYDKIGMPLIISGNINKVGVFELTETDNKGNKTGVFKGSFTTDAEIQGTWINSKTNKEFPFILKEVTEGIAQFDFADYYHENCFNRNNNLKSHKKDTLSWQDTLCSSIEVSLIHVKNLNTNACKKINNYLTKSILETKIESGSYKNMHELFKSIDDTVGFNLMTFDYDIGVISNEKDILCISLSFYANTGGAHPNGVYYYYNFNTQTGDIISLKEILMPEKMDDLIEIAEKKFVEANGGIKETGWFYDDAQFKLTTNFSITKGGLLFVYQQYEAGPYAMGMPQFVIPFSELNEIVKPEYLK